MLLKHYYKYSICNLGANNFNSKRLKDIRDVRGRLPGFYLNTEDLLMATYRFYNSHGYKEEIKFASSKQLVRGTFQFYPCSPENDFEIPKDEPYIALKVVTGLGFSFNVRDGLVLRFVQVRINAKDHRGFDTYIFKLEEAELSSIKDSGDTKSDGDGGVGDPDNDLPK